MDKTIVDSPKITVLMPVYNSELYIQESVESILDQTYTNFEFLIIDDASTDGTLDIIKGFNDGRIILIEKKINKGLTHNLNYGLSIAKGMYVARMDADDISLSDRLSKQLAFMEANLDVVACGTKYSIIGSDGIMNVPISHEEIKVQLLKKTCFAHPTVMMRKSVLDQLPIKYDVTKVVAQDYDLWVRLVNFGKLHNLPDVLLKYRLHQNQVSKRYTSIKRLYGSEIRLKMLGYLDYEKIPEEEKVLKKIIYRNEQVNFNEIKLFKDIKVKLIEANKLSFFNTNGFISYLNYVEKVMLKDYFFKRNKYTPELFNHYLILRRMYSYKLSYKNTVKLFVKSFF